MYILCIYSNLCLVMVCKYILKVFESLMRFIGHTFSKEFCITYRCTVLAGHLKFCSAHFVQRTELVAVTACGLDLSG
jgi:hypothetical protein